MSKHSKAKSSSSEDVSTTLVDEISLVARLDAHDERIASQTDILERMSQQMTTMQSAIEALATNPSRPSIASVAVTPARPEYSTPPDRGASLPVRQHFLAPSMVSAGPPVPVPASWSPPDTHTVLKYSHNNLRLIPAYSGSPPTPSARYQSARDFLSTFQMAAVGLYPDTVLHPAAFVWYFQFHLEGDAMIWYVSEQFLSRLSQFTSMAHVHAAFCRPFYLRFDGDDSMVDFRASLLRALQLPGRANNLQAQAEVATRFLRTIPDPGWFPVSEVWMYLYRQLDPNTIAHLRSQPDFLLKEGKDYTWLAAESSRVQHQRASPPAPVTAMVVSTETSPNSLVAAPADTHLEGQGDLHQILRLLQSQTTALNLLVEHTLRQENVRIPQGRHPGAAHQGRGYGRPFVPRSFEPRGPTSSRSPLDSSSPSSPAQEAQPPSRTFNDFRRSRQLMYGAVEDVDEYQEYENDSDEHPVPHAA